jgi:MFS family permease
MEPAGWAETTKRAAPWFYYGWVNVGVASVAMSATLPGRTYGLSLIKEPLRSDLNISDLRFNVLNFWAIVLGSVLCFPAGRLIDRLGGRAMLVAVAVTLGLSVLLMSRAAGESELFVTLTCVRGLGQGALSVVSIALIGKWFKRRIGPAMGVFAVLLALGFILPIFAVGEVVKARGWRTAWEYVGLALVLGLAPLGWLLARSSPEDCGIPPDEPVDEPGAPHGQNMALGAALKTPAFWIYTVAATLFNLVFSALTLDNQSLLEERGLDREKTNELILGVLMASGLPVNLLVGWLARRHSMGMLLGFGVGLLTASLLTFPTVRDTRSAVAYAVLLGSAGGAITVIYFAIYGHTFGRTHLGAIQATVQVLSVLASAAGPVILAATRVYLNSSDPFFYGFALATAILSVAVFLVRPPTQSALTR